MNHKWNYRPITPEQAETSQLNEANPNEQVIKIKALESFEKAADGQATKIIVPSEIQSLAGLAASFKGLLEDEKK